MRGFCHCLILQRTTIARRRQGRYVFEINHVAAVTRRIERCLNFPKSRRCAAALQPAMEGARFAKVEVRRGDLRWPLPKDFAQRLQGQDRDRPRPAREISARRSVLRRRAGHASRHVGLVSCFAWKRRCHGRPLLSRALQARRARPRRVSHVVRRDRDLQRSAPLRLDEARGAGQARRRAAAERARPRAARQCLRRRHAGARLHGQEDEPQGGAAGPADRRRARQHLCLRGAASRAAFAQTHGLDDRRPKRRAERARRDGWSQASRRCSTRRSRPAARRCAITGSPTASSACSSIASGSTIAKASHAGRPAAAAPSNASCRTAARRFIVRCARNEIQPGNAHEHGKHEHGKHHRRDPRPGRTDPAQPAAGAQRAQHAR